jgi:hypothetical protein
VGFGDFFSGVGDWFSSFGGGGGSTDLGTRGTSSLGEASAPGGLWGAGYSSTPGFSGLADPSASIGSVGGLNAGYGGGGGDWFSNLFGSGGSNLNSILGGVNNLAKLGVTGLGAASAIQGMGQGATQNKMALQSERGLRGIGTEFQQSALPLMTAGSSAMLGGSLPPGLQQQVEDYKRTAKGQLRDYYARNGIADSDTLARAEAEVDNRALMLQEQLAAQLYQSGTAGMTGAVAPTAAYGQVAAASAGGAAQQTSNVYKNIAQIMGAQ